MKIKPTESTLFLFAGILFLISALLNNELNYMFGGVGFALITIGITKRKKESLANNIEEE